MHTTSRKSRSGVVVVLLSFCIVCSEPTIRADNLSDSSSLRPPAYPLVVCDPYFSIWSFGDLLAQSDTKHWTEVPHRLCSLARIDGVTYRLMGAQPRSMQTMVQKGVNVGPTVTSYMFEARGVELQMLFMTPVLPLDLDVLSRPVAWIGWNVRSVDGKPHDVKVYLDASAEICVNTAEQHVAWSRSEVEGLEVMRCGSVEQPILEKAGDDRRIDWGYLYLAAPKNGGREAIATMTYIGGASRARGSFAARQGPGSLPENDDPRNPRAASDQDPVLAAALDLGQVAPNKLVEVYVLLAYDDLYSIEYFGRKLRPYWRKTFESMEEMLRAAADQHSWRAEGIGAACQEFDKNLMSDLTEAGGPKYARLCALAHRQALGAQKLVLGPDDERPLSFSKENNSNGCIGTVDVMYPAAPQMMLLSNDLLKATVRPILEYAAMERWPFPFAPHDLGRYPKANGQAYGGGEKSEDRQMMVEECGNMLILLAAISKIDGNVLFAQQYWPQLKEWADYLKAKGLDPENQLCTDDFAGHLAHNVNLSVKAIEALGAFSLMCRMEGKDSDSAQFRSTAERFAQQWLKMADDGDHYRLAFDAPDTWSLKYNLIWDRLLDLNLFPEQVAKREIAEYQERINAFGLPLDNREDYAKLDWEVWAASLAGSRDDFDMLMDPVYRFVNETQDRVPLTDWHWTSEPRRRGFKARSVVGGVFIRPLCVPEIWNRWIERQKTAKG